MPMDWVSADGMLVEQGVDDGGQSVNCPAPDCWEPIGSCHEEWVSENADGLVGPFGDGNESEFPLIETRQGEVYSEEFMGESPLTDSVPLGEVTDAVLGDVVEETVVCQVELPPELVPAVMEEIIDPLSIERPEATVPAEAPESSVLVPEGGQDEVVKPESVDLEPVVHDPLQMDSPDAAADAPPATEVIPPSEPEPINIFEAEEETEATLEPVRRWIHVRGDRSLVARFVGLPDRATCLLEVGSRRIAVPIGNLSVYDRAYVDRTVERLAAARAADRAVDTASL